MSRKVEVSGRLARIDVETRGGCFWLLEVVRQPGALPRLLPGSVGVALKAWIFEWAVRDRSALGFSGTGTAEPPELVCRSNAWPMATAGSGS